ncbi:hypothetical protein N7450_004775 [Penicillium hetheringtonii]|uniref:Uncharacterized protein n=1 Tax=Penicillium hetheringtonii TaxID=911720 RepID=A0AAD6GUQ6_9EURO|nr:hypothetical protein N7450_004775 [Penicillium hetheringtonii]
MASEGIFSAQNAPPAPAAAPVVSEQSQPVHSVLSPSHKESETSVLEKAKAAAGGEHPAAPTAPTELKPSASSSAEHPLSGAIGSTDVHTSTEHQKGDLKPTNQEPQTGEKRAFDSTVVADSAPSQTSVPATAPAPVSDTPTPAAPAPAPITEATSSSAPISHPAPAPAPTSASGEKDKPVSEKPDEPKAKKQKIESESSKDANGSVPPSSSTDTKDAQGKNARPKKEKIKDAVKKAIPTDGIGSRTRSRTKPT